VTTKDKTLENKVLDKEKEIIAANGEIIKRDERIKARAYGMGYSRG
jgi:hypothetical protein